ncbi:MAG: dihydrofolate reductase [Saprospiraceae bacterium]|nr:dihydrofolate reductase [Saprospiraceae bacterium]
MREIIYYVATSLDGYIAGPDEDISLFAFEGNGVEQYQKDLQGFDTVIMGRKTYEFGYKFGLQPGAPAYPHMRHYIFSSTMVLENADEKVKVVPMDLKLIQQLKAEEGTPIYLCGGGEFAAWLLAHDLIDVLKVKLNPIVLGGGTPLFGSSTKAFKGRLESSESYEGGLMFNTYRLNP